MEQNSQLKNILSTFDENEYLDSEEAAKSNQDYIIKSLSEDEVSSLKGLDENTYIKIIDEIVSGRSAASSIDLLKHKSSRNSQRVENLQDLDEFFLKSNFEEIFNSSSNLAPNFIEFSKQIPLRLTYEERRVLFLLESALEVSDYTDKIDVYHRGNEARRINHEIKHFCAILSGLAIAHNYEDGQRLFRDCDFSIRANFFSAVFEIGRRYKILNPERMRASYGKLMYFLMDSRKQTIQGFLNFDPIQPVHTVYDLLVTKKNGLSLLTDPLLPLAISEISTYGKSRKEIEKEIYKKEQAVKALCRKYNSDNSPKKSLKLFGLSLNIFGRYSDYPENSNECSEDKDELSPEIIEQCIYSLSDHYSYLLFNRDPCDRMLNFLVDYFHPTKVEEKFNLSISIGVDGARLIHDHTKQFKFVYQSLTLWREIAQNMFFLWHCAEHDLLNPDNFYQLRDTGQGLHRIQDSPMVEKAMNYIIRAVKRRTGDWVGSTVVHLGDRNVPNSLFFIDKYTQVPRILTPIILCLDKLQEVYNSTPEMKQYINSQFGGLQILRKTILADFFRHGFDGSGADSFNDAGSCIDGRLTSAWNWCNSIEKKPYFPAFLLTGFTGFDGRF